MNTDVLQIGLMIVGAPKAGTTSLVHYLARHPQVVTHSQREMIYFGSDAAYPQGPQWARMEYFPYALSEDVLCAKSVAIMYSRTALLRLRADVPKVRVVITLRDPVTRAYSEYWYARRRGWENRETFEEAIADSLREGPRPQHAIGRTAYLDRSNYDPFIRDIYGVFDRDAVKIVLLEDLWDRPAEVCGALLKGITAADQPFTLTEPARHNGAARPRSRRVLRLLSSADAAKPLRFAVRQLVPRWARTAAKARLQALNEIEFKPPPMDYRTREAMAAWLSPGVQALEDRLGRNLTHWGKGEVRASSSQPTQPTVSL